MNEANVIGGLVGGALIGCAAVLLLLLNGRIAGISGILAGLITSPAAGERAWRFAVLVGLITGAGLYAALTGGLPLELQAGSATLAVAGLLVGLGTRLGSGCTSGHGVCGIARRSPRSVLATVVFIAVAVGTVYLTRHVF
jgi:uncharacterized membrane protein YedE/YeeE